MKKVIRTIFVIVLCIMFLSTKIVCAQTTQTEDVETAQTVQKLKETGEYQAEEASTKNKEKIDSMGLSCKSYVLMEGSTGAIIASKDKDLKMEPASITKIMTLILIFEAIDSGKIKLTDEVTVSEHAASMGGSQVYLEPFETQTVDTMIKCISIASANDASVAMAEMIGGSEEEFVKKMNDKAKELGMKNTTFENCCGLDDKTVNHMSTAYDVALMSRELITKHPQISNYSTVWMDTFTHVTRKGESEFGLTNTNKLVRTYDGITGLKTGSTSKAKFCLSATARKNGMNLIAVVMSAPEPKTRFQEAAKLLDYGFANCSLYQDDNKNLTIAPVVVVRGVKDTVIGVPKGTFSYVCLTGKNPKSITKEILMEEEVKAPVEKNTQIGKIIYKLEGKEIGIVPILTTEAIRKATYKDAVIKCMKRFFVICNQE